MLITFITNKAHFALFSFHITMFYYLNLLSANDSIASHISRSTISARFSVIAAAQTRHIVMHSYLVRRLRLDT